MAIVQDDICGLVISFKYALQRLASSVVGISSDSPQKVVDAVQLSHHNIPAIVCDHGYGHCSKPQYDSIETRSSNQIHQIAAVAHLLRVLQVQLLTWPVTALIGYQARSSETSRLLVDQQDL